MELADLTIHAKICLQNRATARFCVIPGFWPRWALSWPESGIAVPATLVFGLGCLQWGRGARKTQKRDLRAILRYTGVLAVLGCRGRNPA